MVDPRSKEFQEVYFNTIAAETKKRKKKSNKNIFDKFGIERID